MRATLFWYFKLCLNVTIFMYLYFKKVVPWITLLICIPYTNRMQAVVATSNLYNDIPRYKTGSLWLFGVQQTSWGGLNDIPYLFDINANFGKSPTNASSWSYHFLLRWFQIRFRDSKTRIFYTILSISKNVDRFPNILLLHFP